LPDLNCKKFIEYILISAIYNFNDPGDNLMTMSISIVGSGYVGLVTGMGFVKLGYHVTFIDVDDYKIDHINQSKPPIYEEGLEELMQVFKGNYKATRDYKESIMNSKATFISVGTPTGDDGSIDLSYIKEVSAEIGKVLKDKAEKHVVVVKSTVIPGTTEEVVKPLVEEYSGKSAYTDFGLAMNPEFLREGVALDDFLNPDRIVIGCQDEYTRILMDEIYKPFTIPKLFAEIKTAEMIKYTANGFLATKISYANEIGNMCKKMGINSDNVFEGVGLDHRIAPYAFKSGAGFGGSCFPKDVKALVRKSESLGVTPRILKATLEVNEHQPLILIDLLKKHIPELNGKTIGLLGLAFKPNSDDIRETRAVPIVETLLKEGANIIAHDTLATENFKKMYPNLEYPSNAQDVIDKSEYIIVQTEWEEYEKLDFTNKTVIDGRRVESAKKAAKVYEGICW
jgi:UDPglucose 6-dehydrogenase